MQEEGVIEEESLPEQKQKTCLSVNRIVLGIVCGAVLLSFLFSIWDCVVNGAGPVIGIIIFQLITLGGLGFMIYNTQFLNPNLYLAMK